jgi:predicted Zn-dependent protease
MTLVRGVLAIVLLVVPLATFAAPTATETTLGNQAYAELRARHELLDDTPEAAVLDPVAQKIGAVAGAEYGAPFSFYIDRSLVPNAFVVYGPRVYVDRGLVGFADSQEELAGVICHEVNHVIHRDTMHDDTVEQQYDTNAKKVLARAHKVTLGLAPKHTLEGTMLMEQLMLLRHSRGVEERADLAGADLCAHAGINPWGMVWMFEKLLRYAPSHGMWFLSDHPSSRARIEALRKHFKSNPALFAHWSSDESSSTPLRFTF